MRTLSAEQRREAYISWRTAVVALAECCGALRDLEEELGTEVNGRDLTSFAEEEDWSAHAFERFLAGRVWPA